MAKFDMIWSNLPLESIAIDIDFLTNVTNWDHGSIREISVRILKVDQIR